MTKPGKTWTWNWNDAPEVGRRVKHLPIQVSARTKVVGGVSAPYDGVQETVELPNIGQIQARSRRWSINSNLVHNLEVYVYMTETISVMPGLDSPFRAHSESVYRCEATGFVRIQPFGRILTNFQYAICENAIARTFHQLLLRRRKLVCGLCYVLACDPHRIRNTSPVASLTRHLPLPIR